MVIHIPCWVVSVLTVLGGIVALAIVLIILFGILAGILDWIRYG
jgi:hypothetical protein